MLKRLLAFAAVAALCAGMARGADMSLVDGTTAVATGSASTDAGASGATTIEVVTASSGVLSGAGGSATYIVDGGYTLNVASSVDMLVRDSSTAGANPAILQIDSTAFLTVQSGGIATVVNSGASIENSGTAIFDGALNLANGATFNNLAGGTLSFAATANFTATGTGDTVTNVDTGRIQIAAGMDATSLDYLDGAISQSAGTIAFTGTGALTPDLAFTNVLGGTIETGTVSALAGLDAGGAKIRLQGDIQINGNLLTSSADPDAVGVAAGKNVTFNAPSTGQNLGGSLTVADGATVTVQDGVLTMSGAGKDLAFGADTSLTVVGNDSWIKDVNNVTFGENFSVVMDSVADVYNRLILENIAGDLANADGSAFSTSQLGSATLDGTSWFNLQGDDLYGNLRLRAGDTPDAYRRQMADMGYNPGLLGDGYLDNVRSYHENKGAYGSGYNNFNRGTDSGAVNDGYYKALSKGANNGDTFEVILPRSGETMQFTMSDGWNDAKNGGTIVHPVSIARQVTEILAGDVWKINLNNLQRRIAAMDPDADDCGTSTTLVKPGYCRNFWAGYIDLQQEAGAYQGRDGYTYDGRGVQVGYDSIRDALLFGGALAYLEGDYEDDIATAHDSKLEHYNLSLYATYLLESGLFGTALAGYTYSDNSVREFRGNWTDEDYKTNTWYLGGRLGYVWRRDGKLAFIPSAGIGYIDSRAGGHTIYTNGIPTESISTGKSSSVMVPLELRASYDIDLGDDGRLLLTANAGYTYYFNGDGPSSWITDLGHNAPVAVAGVNHPQGKSQWNLGAGLRYSVDRFDIDVNYDYFKRSQAKAHRLLANAGVQF